MAVRPIVFLFGENGRDKAVAARLLDEWGFTTKAFDSRQTLLKAATSDIPDCFVIDSGSPGSIGLELCRRLSQRVCGRPFVVLCGRGDAAQAVEAIRLGASEVIETPVDHVRLITAVRRAIKLHAERRQAVPQTDGRINSLAELTPREREVWELAAGGRPTQQIAIDLGISRKTVEVHCFRIKRKFGAASLAQLLPLTTSRGNR